MVPDHAPKPSRVSLIAIFLLLARLGIGAGSSRERRKIGEKEVRLKRILVLVWLHTSLNLHAADLSGLSLREGVVDGVGDAFVLVLADNLSAGATEALLRSYQEAYVPTVGWGMDDYFWRDRDPDEVSTDLERVLEEYLGKWHKARVILVGSGAGANVLPFMVNRLPEAARARVEKLVLIAPAEKFDFHPHAKHWFFGLGRTWWDVKAEITQLNVQVEMP